MAIFAVLLSLLCIVNGFVPSPPSYAGYCRSRLINLKMLAAEDVLKFGSKMSITVKLPTKDRDLALLFLSKTSGLVENTWDKERYTKVSDGIYLLKMKSLVMPGIDIITPEMEVNFSFNPLDGLVRMQSGNWQLRGSERGILKDSRFMQSFNISLTGQLGLNTANGSDAPVEAVGWVNYDVEGEKPSIFKAAPKFVLDSTVAIIKESVSEFASKEFSKRLLVEFRKFLLTSMQDQKSKAALGTVTGS